MYYVDKTHHGVDHLGIKVVFILIGLAVGAWSGLYIAAKTLPLPHDYTPVYIIKH